MSSGDTVVIGRDLYEDLLNTEKFMDALHKMGVAKWAGYNEAVDMWENDDR